MARDRASASPAQGGKKTNGRRLSKSSGFVRYPEWKLDLFRTGISERQQSRSGQLSGRALRPPGA